MDSREFFNKVALMRQLQQEYFRTRSRSVLTNCKNIERSRRGDKACKRYYGE